MKKGIIAGFVVCSLMFSIQMPLAVSAERADGTTIEIAADDVLPQVTADAAVVLEADTGKVVYQRNMDKKMFPASTTKIMTLIVALEKGNLDDVVTISKNAANTEGSTLWLEEGEKVKLIDLLYGMMLVSGNDATVAVAEHIAGSVPAFARMMTDKAKEIGAVHTSFVNSSGLPDDRHFTTAHDMALIAAYGYKNPMFAKIVSTQEKKMSWTKNADKAPLRNENRMLWLYDGANGVKTGYTDAAGRCLVSAAKRDGVQLIAVVLDSTYMWNDSIALLDYGFGHVHAKKLYAKGDVVKNVHVVSGREGNVDVKAAEEVNIPVTNGEGAKFSTEIEVPDSVQAGFNKGDVLGRVVVKYEGKEVKSADLIAAKAVEKKSFFADLYSRIVEWAKKIF